MNFVFLCVSNSINFVKLFHEINRLRGSRYIETHLRKIDIFLNSLSDKIVAKTIDPPTLTLDIDFKPCYVNDGFE